MGEAGRRDGSGSKPPTLQKEGHFHFLENIVGTLLLSRRYCQSNSNSEWPGGEMGVAVLPPTILMEGHFHFLANIILSLSRKNVLAHFYFLEDIANQIPTV